MKTGSAASLRIAVLVLSAIPASAQNSGWIRQFGTSSWDSARASAPDGSGGVYASGGLGGQFGGPNVGSGPVWLGRFDGGGNRTWIRQFGASGSGDVTGAVPDGTGGVFLTGSAIGSFGGPGIGLDDVWLAHYDSTGNQTWIRQFGTSDDEDAYAAATDGAGGMYLAGWAIGNFGGPSAGGGDAWIARYDSAGNQSWIRKIGGAATEYAYAVVGAGGGGVYVSGATTGSLAGPSSGSEDIWIARYDSAGNQVWIRQFGSSGSDEPYAAASAGSLGVYLSGRTSGSVGGPNAGIDDIWIARYDSGGNQAWVKQIGTNDYDHPAAVTPDGSGGVFVSGSTRGSLGGPNSGSDDAWLARYDNAGSQLWIRQFGTSSVDYARPVATDGSGGVYVGGSTQGSLGGPIEGASDAWLARYDGAGNGPCSTPSISPSALIATGISETEVALSWMDNSGDEDGFTVERGQGGTWTLLETTAPDVASFHDTTAPCGATPDYRVRAINCAGSSTSAQASASTWICCTSPVAYCAAKINSLGCTPSIGFTGIASFSGPDNFRVTASNVMNSKPGLMIWGLTAASTPFFGGTLCLAAPITRTPGQNSLGSSPPAQDCTGTYSFHFSQAYMLSQLLPSGTQVRAQYWSRDPGFAAPNKVGLTNALSFLICQ